MRVKPSPKHAKKIHKTILEGMDSPYLDIHKPFIKVVTGAIRKAYSVKIKIRKDFAVGYAGFWDHKTRTLEIARHTKSLDTFTTLCHEVCHMYCTDNKIFNTYHTQQCTLEQLEKLSDHGVELYVENMAEQLFHLFFPGQQFYRTIHPGEGNGAKK